MGVDRVRVRSVHLDVWSVGWQNRAGWEKWAANEIRGSRTDRDWTESSGCFSHDFENWKGVLIHQISECSLVTLLLRLLYVAFEFVLKFPYSKSRDRTIKWMCSSSDHFCVLTNFSTVWDVVVLSWNSRRDYQGLFLRRNNWEAGDVEEWTFAHHLLTLISFQI